jgi:hypothetical protein
MAAERMEIGALTKPGSRRAETSQVVKGTGHTARVGAREVRRVGQHGKLHVGRVEHLPTVGVGGDEAEQPL